METIEKSEALLAAVNLTCVRDNQLIFKALSFQVFPGEILCIQGANGCGKSSLIRILVGLHSPYQGEVYWQNKNIATCMHLYNRELHYIGHSNGLKLNLTVLENLLLFNFYQQDAINVTRILSVLTELKLAAYQHVAVKKLSAGLTRRVALAKLLLWQKKIWLLDEPFITLDQVSQERLIVSILTHTQSGGSVLMSSHQALPNTLTHQIISLGGA